MHREGGCNSYVLGALELERGLPEHEDHPQILSAEALGCKMLSNLWCLQMKQDPPSFPISYISKAEGILLTTSCAQCLVLMVFCRCPLDGTSRSQLSR